MEKLALHGGNVWQFNKKNIIDFSANINPLGLSKKVEDCITDNIDTLVHYPDPYCQSLKKDFAHYLKINPENILFGNGSIELMYLIPLALRIEKVGIPIPSFSEYEYASKNIGARCVFIKTKDKEGFRIEINNLAKFLYKVELLFLGHPNNPTGQIFSKEELIYLLRKARDAGVYVIIDEVFIDFIRDKDSLSLIKNAPVSKNLIILRSLTKFFALAGLRLGYIVAEKELIRRIERFQYPWAVNTLAQLAAKQVLKDTNYIKRSYQFILKEKDFLFNEFKKINSLQPIPPSANFILCRLKHSKYSSTSLANVLSKKGILIRDCSNFRGLGEKYFRVAVRTRRENQRLVSILKRIL